MYIPRPAKLLFTIDEGWNKFIEKFGDNVGPWTRLSVKRMLGLCHISDMKLAKFALSVI